MIDEKVLVGVTRIGAATTGRQTQKYTTCVQEAGLEGPEIGPKQLRSGATTLSPVPLRMKRDATVDIGW